MKFKSAVDSWFILLAAVFPAVVFIVAIAAASPMPAGAWATVAVVGILLLGLPVWLFTSTAYEVGNDVLLVRSGPFRWRIPLSEITSVEPSRSLLSSPALSLDRLRIRYGKHRAVLVSPKDKAGFMRALGVAG
jgi:membrane protein YdbS with pleckstrin-like domain